MKSENTDQKSKSFKTAHSSFPSSPSEKSKKNVSSSPQTQNNGFDVKKLQKRLKMSVDKEKQFSELMESTARVMAMNAIQNILYVKEAMGKDQDKDKKDKKDKEDKKDKNPRLITYEDIKDTQALMKRMQFYGNIQYGGAESDVVNVRPGPLPPAFFVPREDTSEKSNQNGGSRAESFPSSYFNPNAAKQEPYYSKSEVAPLETMTSRVATDSGLARPSFVSSFHVDNMSLGEQDAGFGIQRGGNAKNDKSVKSEKSDKSEQQNNAKLPMSKEHMVKDDIYAVIDKLNNKYKKNKIELQNSKVLNKLKETVNANLENLFSFYRANVSKEVFEVEKIKEIINTNPRFLHLSKVPRE